MMTGGTPIYGNPHEKTQSCTTLQGWGFDVNHGSPMYFLDGSGTQGSFPVTFRPCFLGHTYLTKSDQQILTNGRPQACNPPTIITKGSAINSCPSSISQKWFEEKTYWKMPYISLYIYIWKIICFHAVFDLNQSLIEPKVNLETQASWLQDESEGGCLAGNPWVVRDSIAPVIAPVPSHLPQLWNCWNLSGQYL